MGLTPGARLGPYEIVAAIGAGGMGEVYRARDTRLGRMVALKILPAQVAADADRRLRFEREAQAVARLSHPNILTLFDYGVDEDVAFAVTELLEGHTLRDLLAPGALATRKAVEYAVQIARGLAAAHDKQFVHRDLKPENVFVLSDGQVKILDFGLARQTNAIPVSAGETALALTDPGTVVGTVGYMAPEQVRGDAVDARTDLFAFGAVLYEMLTGVRAFQRATSAETMTAILREDPPPMTTTARNLPPALERIVQHCLEKNPSERFQTARDVVFALDVLSGSTISGRTSGIAGAAVSRPRRATFTRAALGVVAIVLAGAAGYALAARHDRGTAPAFSFDRKTFEPMMITNARFLPDGQTLVYSAAPEGVVPQVFVLRPDSVVPEATLGPGTQLLSVSSKGELAVLTNAVFQHHRVYTGTLARLSMGGAPRPWLEHVREADWAPDGSSAAVVHEIDRTTVRLEYPVGTTLYQTRGYVSDLRVSPDGTRVAFFDHDVRNDDRGWLKVVDTSKHVTTLAGEYRGLEGLVWSRDGSTIFFGGQGSGEGGDMRPLAVAASAGSPVRAVINAMGEAYPFDIAGDGRLLVVRRDRHNGFAIRLPGDTADRDLSWLDYSSGARLTMDGKSFVFTDENTYAGKDYAVMLRASSGSPPVTLGPGYLDAFSPDGRWAAATVPSRSRHVLYPTGPGEAITIDADAAQFPLLSWYPDSAHLLLCGGRPSRCYKEAIAGGPRTAVTGDGAIAGDVAPDGKILAIENNGHVAVYPAGSLTPEPARGLTEADAIIGWSSDSRTVFASRRGEIPAHLERIDVATGTRTPVADVGPTNRAGLTRVVVTSVIDQGRGYAYDYLRFLSTLFVATPRAGGERN
jgi:hypothetical protein